MTNIAQMVNVLQAMILTDGPKMVLTPTYHVFQMYIPFQGATFLPTEISSPEYKLGNYNVAAVSVSAARDTEGRLQLALVNLDPNREAVVTTTVNGAQGEWRRRSRAHVEDHGRAQYAGASRGDRSSENQCHAQGRRAGVTPAA